MAYTLLSIGPKNARAEKAWLASSLVDAIVRQPSEAVTGKRLNKRVLGIGLDSLLLALRTLMPGIKGPYLANNPWIAAALRITGRKDFAVTGIYAEPGSRSWKVLKALIGQAPVITLSESEAAAWNADGGNARAALYGNSFGYPQKSVKEYFHIFVGGNSDRDKAMIAELEREVLASRTPVRLTLAIGGEESTKEVDGNVVHRPGQVDQKEFGELLSASSVAFLPLRSGIRAAGHMVLVGSLECGVPVALTPIDGMTEYVFGSSIHLCDPSAPILPQLFCFAADAPPREAVAEFWRTFYSLENYVERVTQALEGARKGERTAKRSLPVEPDDR